MDMDKDPLPNELGIRTALGAAMVMLGRARAALADLNSADRERAATGVYLIAVFGRATTQALQHIATYDREHFNAWWPPRGAALGADPVCQFFTKVRNAFLKEGTLFHTGRNMLVSVGPLPADPTQTAYRIVGPIRKGILAPGMDVNGIKVGPSIQELARDYFEQLDAVIDATFKECHPQLTGEAPPPSPE